MAKLRTAACLVATLLLAACDVVTLPAPAGRSVPTLQPEQWNGAWVDADGQVFHVLLGVDPGTLQVAGVGEEDGKLTMDVKSVFVRSAGSATLVSALASDDDETELAKDEPRYVWALMRRDDEQVLIFTPDADAFAKMIENEALQGVVVEGDVHLDSVSDAQWESIIQAAVFAWESPLVLRRL